MSPHVVIIDNYDSFTFNLAQVFGTLGARVSVHRNDALELDDLVAMGPDHLVISPGPGGPQGTGICSRATSHFRGEVPVLGVCLGHQVLAASFGLEVVPATSPVHGKAWEIHHEGEQILAGLSRPFLAARYHSLIVRGDVAGRGLRPLAWTEEGELMAVAVPGEPTWGVQFHPESYMTPEGPRLLENFLAARVAKTAHW